jgi:beta-mannosidase
MQLSQGLGLKINIESMRIRKPSATQITFYKLTEDYPAASWATIDYYGLPKLSHYLTKEAYAPVHVMSVYDDWNDSNGVLKLLFYGVNDTATDVTGTLKAVLYDAALQPVWRHEYPVTITPDAALHIAEESIEAPKANGAPLFLCLDLTSESGKLVDRDWSYYNFTTERGSLFKRPRTTLAVKWANGPTDRLKLSISNSGTLPAAGVTVSLGQGGFSYYASDSLFWLQPGETRQVAIERIAAVDGKDRELSVVKVSAWNAMPQDLAVPLRTGAR